VRPGSSAATAGIQPGDLLISYDGVEVRRGFSAVYERLVQKMGQRVKVVVTRGSENKALEMQVEGQEYQGYKITEVAQPTPDQLKIREIWLKQNNQ
jgi:predicted metalloprotease with PDZ domain